MIQSSNPDTSSVTVTFELKSSQAAPPFHIAECTFEVTDANGGKKSSPGWGTQKVGKPKGGGADFSVVITDADFSGGSRTSVAKWAVTFIPRAPTTDQSPFGNNKNTIAGAGGTANGGSTTLDIGSGTKIKNAGKWDYAVMVQIVCADGTVKCFASDPQMEVDA